MDQSQPGQIENSLVIIKMLYPRPIKSHPGTVMPRCKSYLGPIKSIPTQINFPPKKKVFEFNKVNQDQLKTV